MGMELFLSIVLISVIGYAVFGIVKVVSDEIDSRNLSIKHLKEQLSSSMQTLKDYESSAQATVRTLLEKPFADSKVTYATTINALQGILKNMESTLVDMKRINDALINESRKENQNHEITEKSKVIARVNKMIDGMKNFEKKVYTFPIHNMMKANEYGKVNKTYYDEVCSMQRNEVVTYISKCESLLSSTQYDQLFAIDLGKVLRCVWFFATEKSFATSDYQKAEGVFMRIHKYAHADIILAGCYAKKKVGGEEILREPVRELLKREQDDNKLAIVASGLMWMGAYQSENSVLQHMLTTGMNMSVKMQERLHSLSNGGGKAPNRFEVDVTDDSLYFDISSLAWREEEYVGLFENLSFQDKTLNYSLALRDEDKDMFIPQGINVPDISTVLVKIREVFADEYGSDTVAKVVNCVALSGSGEERMAGILAVSNDCKQLGVLIHIARIGKKVIIKFYTLFIPIGTELSVQKQQVLSMSKKLSPSVTMWESSMKDTMLMAVEQLLNTSVQPTDSNESTAQENVMQAKVETIF